LLLLLVTALGTSISAQAASVCSPGSTVSGPYAQDGAGDLCFQTSDLCSYINSWNLSALEVNGNPYTNVYVASSSIAPLNGVYIIHYVSTVAWGHFEFGGTCSGGGPTNTPITPTRTNTPDVVTNTPTPTRTPTGTIVVGDGPDLTVVSVTYVGSSPTCANNNHNDVLVRNIGVASAGTFVVSYGYQTQTVSGLAAGQSVTLSFSSMAGTVTATADSTNVIAENDETNNSLVSSIPSPTQARTCTPTSFPSFTPTGTPTIVTPTKTPTATACPAITGYVRVGSSTGPGLPGVLVTGTDYLGSTTGTTNSSGFYVLIGCGRYNMTITPQLSGYVFSPAQQIFAPGTSGSFDFVATTGSISAEFSGTPLQGPAPLAVTFSSPGVVGTISCTWTFGDGTGLVGDGGCPTSVSHTYTSTGSYTVTLHVAGAPNDVTKTDYIVVSSGPTNTPTPTSIVPTFTPTPTSALPCSPVDATITGPFTHDGVGDFCWQVTGLNSFINSYNLASLKVNDVDFTNVWVPVSSLPPKINGYWYFDLLAYYPWSHVEGN